MHTGNLQHEERGFALLLALIVSSVVLAIGLSILNISVSQLTLSSTARESEYAFQSAHAGTDCMWYWRNEEHDSYTVLNDFMPVINCFAENPLTYARTTIYSEPEGHANLFFYAFEWGDPGRCTEIEMVVMNAHSGDIGLNFANKAVGNDGLKECSEGNMCTVIFSRGYNRSCFELQSSIFTVQREITTEF